MATTRSICIAVAVVTAGMVLARPGTVATALLADAPVQSPACAEVCPNAATNPAGAAQCTARIATCQTKLTMYAGYMGQLAAGVALTRLPGVYVDVLQPFYPTANLNTFRFGYSPRQPAAATTDCTTTYVFSQPLVNAIAAGTASSDEGLRLLFHELQHLVQCGRVGGRDRYATMWFRQLEVNFIQNADIVTLHDRMPMEDDANTVEASVLAAVASKRDRNGRLVRPIGATIKRDGAVVTSTSTVVGRSLRLTAQTSGGSDPIKLEWFRKAPAAATFAPISPSDPAFYEFAPDRLGTYEVMVKASQVNSQLEPARVIVTVESVPDPMPMTTAPLSSPARSSASQLNLTKTLSVVVRNAKNEAIAATVCVGTESEPQKYGRAIAGTNGRVTFSVPAGATRQVTAAMTAYIGVARTITMPGNDYELPVSLRPGIGGAVCR